MDMNNERELRQWCLEMAMPIYPAHQLDEALNAAEKLYNFITGEGDISEDESISYGKKPSTLLKEATLNVEDSPSVFFKNGTIEGIDVPHGYRIEISRRL